MCDMLSEGMLGIEIGVAHARPVEGPSKEYRASPLRVS